MLPSHWDIADLDSCAEVLTGFAFQSEKYVEASSTSVRLLRGDNIAPGSLRWNDAKYYPSPVDGSLIRYEMREGDIVIALDRPIVGAGLKCSVARVNDIPCLLVQRVARLRATKRMHQEFLAHTVQARRFISHLLNSKTETAVPHVSPNDIRGYMVHLPPLGEQIRIAELLSTWDKAIAVTEKLLASSQMQKQALLETLLSGRNRFNGCSGCWVQTTLRQIAKIIVSSVDKKHEVNETRVRLCNYTDVYYNERITAQNELTTATASVAEIEKCTLYKGDVVITKDSETADDIAVAAYIDEDIPGLVCGYHLAIIRPDLDRVDPVYLHSYFGLVATSAYFGSRANGVTRFGLSIGAIEDAPITLPDISEQRKIASMLTLCAEEIQRREREISALRLQKSTLLTQLLSGKRRVCVPAAEASS